MSIDEITHFLDGLEGVLTLKPQPGDGSPEISRGDMFFYYADGVIPKTQPFATIVTKDYPDDRGSRLEDERGRASPGPHPQARRTNWA